MSYIVQADDRESTSPVVELLSQSPDFQVAVTRLKLGDYLVDGKFLFERKTLPDLVISIISGRLFTQAIRLATASFHPVIILEGTSRDIYESGMSWESIQGALVTVTLFCGIPLLRARTPVETVRTMLYAAQQGQAYSADSLARHGYRPRGKRARQLFILQGLPGVGPERARQLIARFGTVQAVVQASSTELESVPGIGKGTVEKLRWALEEPHSDYPSAATRRI
jgi:DNA excision repair protein ERCC-4